MRALPLFTKLIHARHVDRRMGIERHPIDEPMRSAAQNVLDRENRIAVADPTELRSAATARSGSGNGDVERKTVEQKRIPACAIVIRGHVAMDRERPVSAIVKLPRQTLPK